MIDTNIGYLSAELQEELEFFPDWERLSIRHIFTDSEKKVVNTIIVNGSTYAYGNFIGETKNEITKKRLIKRYAKLSLYKAVSKYTGIKLPWGALTGVRPTKLAYSAIEESGEFTEFFIDTMKVSSEKTNLVAEVIENQHGIYQKKDDNADLFVFIPFCPSRCRYCSFITADTHRTQEIEDTYIDTLIKEINRSAEFINNLRSIYIGGGTPVALTEKNLDRLLFEIDKINTGVEYTVEAGRPDAITKEKLSVLKAHGVTRVCVNPQTFCDVTLEKIGRKHTTADTLNAYDLAKKDFIVNMDLIAGLPQEDMKIFMHSIDMAISLSPDNITVHSLCVKKGAYLAEEGKKLFPVAAEMVDYAERVLRQADYEAYYVYRQKYASGNTENVGFTKSGKACIYNIDSMEEIADCVACGANGISKKVNFAGEKITRYGSPKDVKTYINKIEEILSCKKSLFGAKIKKC